MSPALNGSSIPNGLLGWVVLLLFSDALPIWRRGIHIVKLTSHIPRDLTASLLRPCYDPGRSTVAIDAEGTQRGRSEEPKDAQGRRPSANILKHAQNSRRNSAFLLSPG